MLKYHRSILFVCMLSGILSACIGEKEETYDYLEKEVAVGDKVPSFIVYEDDNYSGAYFDSADCIGKRTLVVFYNTGCTDCQRELPKINELWETVRTNGEVQLIAIARQQTKAEVNYYWDKEGFTMPTYVDPERKVYGVFANTTIPRLYFVDKDGIVCWMAIKTLSGKQLDQLYELLQ